MHPLFELGQVAFALGVMVVIGERARALFFRSLTSEHAMKWLAARLRAGDAASAQAWARQVPESFVARVLLETLDVQNPERDPDLLRVDLRHAAGIRLGLLRGCATLASALGLLGGILAIRQGLSGGGGLLALQAGLAQQMALADALESMALGVGTSALCFYALGAFRKAAGQLLAQSAHITHLLAEHAADQLAGGGGRGE
ncbi:MAG: hypothetical protein QM778_08920 [Myxococcales bacterium]